MDLCSLPPDDYNNICSSYYCPRTQTAITDPRRTTLTAYRRPTTHRRHRRKRPRVPTSTAPTVALPWAAAISRDPPSGTSHSLGHVRVAAHTGASELIASTYEESSVSPVPTPVQRPRCRDSRPALFRWSVAGARSFAAWWILAAPTPAWSQDYGRIGLYGGSFDSSTTIAYAEVGFSELGQFSGAICPQSMNATSNVCYPTQPRLPFTVDR